MIEVTIENHDEVINTSQPVLLDFKAAWCGTCIILEKVLKPFAETYEGAVIATVNAEIQRELVEKYNIKGLPTVIYLQDGKEVSRSVGAIANSIQNIKAKLDELKASSSMDTTDDF
jgi:thioredoxin 1